MQKKFKIGLVFWKFRMYIIKSSVMLELSAQIKDDELIKNFEKSCESSLTSQVKRVILCNRLFHWSSLQLKK
jgi:hypothetical protein